MEYNRSKISLLGFVTVALIEASCLLALIATLFKNKGLQFSHTVGITLVLSSALLTLWSAWLARSSDLASHDHLPHLKQIRQLTILSFCGALGSLGFLAFSLL